MADSQPLGQLRDAIGYQPTFLVISGIVLLSGIFAFFTLKKDDDQVLGDPFLRDGQAEVVATAAPGLARVEYGATAVAPRPFRK